MGKKAYDPIFWERFRIKTPIRYMYDIKIKKGAEEKFQRSWKRFLSRHKEEMTQREKRFETLFQRIHRDGTDLAFSKRITIRFVSKKMGYGVFALEDIPGYSMLNHYAGIMRPDAEIRVSNDSAFSFSDYKAFCIDAQKTGNWTRFINHGALKSPKTNVLAWEYYREDGPRIVFTASRQGIKKGAQLLYNYGEEYWDEHDFIPI